MLRPDCPAASVLSCQTLHLSATPVLSLCFKGRWSIGRSDGGLLSAEQGGAGLLQAAAQHRGGGRAEPLAGVLRWLDDRQRRFAHDWCMHRLTLPALFQLVDGCPDSCQRMLSLPPLPHLHVIGVVYLQWFVTAACALWQASRMSS